MRRTITAGMFLAFSFLAGAGCDSALTGASKKGGEGFNGTVYARYAPSKVEIMPLTEFIYISDDEETRLKVYVSLLDSFESQLKSPGLFRFELYERVERCSEPKGKRVAIWPDFDLTEQEINNIHWRDFLRAYEFELDFEPMKDRCYVLQVMCVCPNGKRLLDEFLLHSGN